MQKFSGWTALGVIAVSLVISKYLATDNFFQLHQPPLLASENSRDFLNASEPTKIINLNQQTDNLNQSVENLGKQTEFKSTSRTSSLKAISTLERMLFEQINEYRRSRHLSPLVLDARISEQARNHSQAMASGQVPFSQQGLELRSDIISRAIPNQGICETVAYNFGYADPVRAAVSSWINNPKRVVSIEDDYDLVGVGVATNIKGEYYFTQILLRR
ncbi:CAP domain-containing protein [Gloeocapsa sp. BRSZ]